MKMDVEPFEQFYYITDSQDVTIFIKAIDLQCNEIGLPAAFSIVELNTPEPICAQP
jgi:hypothetical protein